MTSEVFFSVIITTHNRPVLVSRAIDSVLKQNYKSYEIVLVNDGSSLSYHEILGRYAGNLIYIESPKTLGVSASRNKGVFAASGMWLVFLDDDDEFEQNYFVNLYNHIRFSNSGIGFIWSNVEVVTYADNEIKARSVIRFSAQNQRKTYVESATIGASYGLAVKKSLIDLTGGFNETFRIGEDSEFLIRLLSAGAQPSVIPLIGVVKHQHNQVRLSSNYTEYSKQNIYESIFSMHLHFLLKNPDILLMMIIWCTRVHFNAGNIDPILRNLIVLKKIFWKVPLRASALYIYISIIAFSSKFIFKKSFEKRASK